NGSAEGYGTMIYYNDGSMLYGEFKDNWFTGEGVEYDFKNGTKSSGIFKEGKLVREIPEQDLKLIYGDKNGFGMRLTEAGIYSGEMKNGVPEGNGFLSCYTGWTITGVFHNGAANGKGTLENVSDGRRYIGELKHNAADGKGTMFYSDGTSETGNFVNGDLVEEKAENQNVAKPEVSWTTPQMINTETTDTKQKIKLCVSSKTPITEVVVSVNGQPQIKKALSRGFSVVTSDCDYSFEYEITLSPGRNTIEASVKNDGGTANAAARYITLNKSDAVSSQKRIALVIGNAAYQHITPLNNSANDARLMSQTLSQLGFEVMSFTDLDRKSMTDKIYDFGDKLKEQNAVGLFYYAGHGLQVNGVNYLVPVTASVKREQEVDDECVSIDKVLGQLEYASNDLNIIILDACRNNPFASVSRSASGDGGLAQMNAPKGTFVAYATAPGKTASDGTGQNGLYTEQLAKAIMTPGKKIEDVFKSVRNEVYNASKSMGAEQIPWENSSIFGDFYFIK
ncbi:MAG: caspase family protein, partial [Bacteroidales bacterium]|nr:caspase family protein [Bacteroidales bacterium]